MHESVCLRACLDGLAIKSNGVYIDATFGRGGHAGSILSKLGPTGRLYAFDRDPDAAVVACSMEKKDLRLKFFNTNFSNIPQEMEKENLMGHVDGILLDLGVSSPQLDTPDRGFSFLQDGPLDMRMDPSQGWPASQWIAEASEQEISSIIRVLGEEKFAKVIATAIVKHRKNNTITSTIQLAELIKNTIPAYEQSKHPATRTFQAIRMHVNDELGQIESVFDGIVPVLAVKARIVVLSYHSLEHICVKNFLKKYGPGNQSPEDLRYGQSKKVRIKRVGKALRPSASELAHNRRARSAFLRVMEKVE